MALGGGLRAKDGRRARFATVGGAVSVGHPSEHTSLFNEAVQHLTYCFFDPQLIEETKSTHL
jgi:hypothetical protein